MSSIGTYTASSSHEAICLFVNAFTTTKLHLFFQTIYIMREIYNFTISRLDDFTIGPLGICEAGTLLMSF